MALQDAIGQIVSILSGLTTARQDASRGIPTRGETTFVVRRGNIRRYGNNGGITIYEVVVEINSPGGPAHQLDARMDELHAIADAFLDELHAGLTLDDHFIDWGGGPVLAVQADESYEIIIPIGTEYAPDA